jgi:hypothetical protein
MRKVIALLGLLMLLNSSANAVQVFLTDDDAYCGKSQICEIDLTWITNGSTISCEFNAPLRGGVIQVEGVLLQKADPIMMLVNTDLGVIPLQVPYSETLFCFTPLK